MQLQINFPTAKKVFKYLFGDGVSQEQRQQAIQEAREEAKEIDEHIEFLGV